MKNTVITIVIAVLASLATFYIAGNHDRNTHAPKETAYDRVMRTGVLRCGYTEWGTGLSKDPNTGAIKGYVADIVETTAAELGLKVVWATEVGYADFAEGLKNGRYDMFCGQMSITSPRARVVTFTSPYAYMPFYIYVRAGDNRFSDYASLNNHQFTYGATDGELFQQLSRQLFPSAHEKSHANMTPPSQLFLDMETRKIDFLMQDLQSFRDYDKANPGKIHRFSDIPIKINPLAFSLLPEETRLRDMFNTGLLMLNNNGGVDKILTKYGLGKNDVFRIRPPIDATIK